MCRIEIIKYESITTSYIYSNIVLRSLSNYKKIFALEMPGIEPGAFHMQSERATTALHPLLKDTEILGSNN